MKKASEICREVAKIHPEVVKRTLAILNECKQAGLKVDVFETRRTLERQKWLKSNGKSKTLNSYHRLGLAVDIVFKTPKGNWTWRKADKNWDQLAVIMEKHGMRSLWKRSGWDGPHCELRFKGVPTATLYRELKACGNDVELFWEKHIDPRLGIYPEPTPTLDELTAGISEFDLDFDLPESKAELEEGVTIIHLSEGEIQRMQSGAGVDVIPAQPKFSFWIWLISLFGGGK